jgi:hypothetical protein
MATKFSIYLAIKISTARGPRVYFPFAPPISSRHLEKPYYRRTRKATKCPLHGTISCRRQAKEAGTSPQQTRRCRRCRWHSLGPGMRSHRAPRQLDCRGCRNRTDRRHRHPDGTTGVGLPCRNPPAVAPGECGESRSSAERNS